MQAGIFGTAIMRGYADQDIVGVRLGIFDEYVEIAIIVEHPGVQQFVLEFFARSSPIGFHEVPYSGPRNLDHPIG
jgi:hypothetical protein